MEQNGLPRWRSGKELTCWCSRSGFSPRCGRSPREGNGNPLQHSCLGNPIDRGAWWAVVHWVSRV